MNPLSFTFKEMLYLGMQTDPATVEDMFAEVRLSSKVIFPRGSVNDFQPLISDRPVDAEVGSFPRLSCFCVTNTCR